MDYQYSFPETNIKPLDDWIQRNIPYFKQEYGIDLHEDKDQWIVELLQAAYEHGVATENEFLTKE